MNITVIGTGFVGVVTSAVLAKFGNDVIGLDLDQKKIESLKRGKVPFFEPHLEELLLAGQEQGKLNFTTDYQEAIQDAEVIFIAVGTPSAADGTADLKYVKAASESLAPYLEDQAIVVLKSTVPPGTNKVVQDIIAQKTDKTFYLASVPEFLKEGSAVDDTLNADRVVIGAKEQFVIDKLLELHKPITGERIVVSPESAQMAKYSANSYLAQRITFINQIANLTEKNGANINEVIKAMGADERIGSHYWYPGLGYGGSCFPKDVKELAAYAREVGEGDGLLVKIDELNDRRIAKKLKSFEEKIGGWAGKKVAILGLSFKPNTNDMREAPSTKVVPILQQKGAQIVGYDPKANEEAQQVISDLEVADNPYTACQDADVVLLLIEWSELIKLDLQQLKSSMKPDAWFVDTRNQYKAETVRAAGFHYLGIGMSHE